MAEQITCNKCFQPIRFLRVKNKNGEIKSHPVNLEAGLLLCTTGTQDEKGAYIYEYKKGYISHFNTCPAAKTQEQEQAGQQNTTSGADSEKPPF